MPGIPNTRPGLPNRTELGAAPSASEPAATYLSVTDSGFSELGAGGAISAGAGNDIDFGISNGQVAASTGASLGGMIGAALFDDGVAEENASLELEVIIGAMPVSSRLCVAMGIGTLPTSMAEIGSGSPYWLEIFRHGNGYYQTRCKVGTAALLSSNAENAHESQHITFQVAADDLGYGPGHVSHRHIKNSLAARATHDSGTKYTHTSGRRWFALTWGKSATAGADETISASFELK